MMRAACRNVATNESKHLKNISDERVSQRNITENHEYVSQRYITENNKYSPRKKLLVVWTNTIANQFYHQICC